MRQYQDIKSQYPNVILFFRMGDFYELFLDDAITAAPVMEIALTSRQSKIPMAGIPHHSADIYLTRLLENGYSIAIAEQEPDPLNPRLMCRRVRRVITPGTVVEENLLQSIANNYLMALVQNHDSYGLSFADISTGDFFSFIIKKTIPETRENLLQVFRDQCAKFTPREILLPTELYNEIIPVPEQKRIVAIEDWRGSPSEGRRQVESMYKQNLAGLGYDKSFCISLGAVSLILHYVQKNFPDSNDKFILQAPLFRSIETQFMQLDEYSIRYLDIVHNQNEGGSKRTLYDVLDDCQTNIGKRFLKESLLFPLLSVDDIIKRNIKIEYLVANEKLCAILTKNLKEVSDLERILSRITAGKAAPRDLIAVQKTLEVSLFLSEIFKQHPHFNLADGVYLEVPEELASLCMRIGREVNPEPPAFLPSNTPFIQEGLDERLDKARLAMKADNTWISDFEKSERQKTNMSSLKVKYNKLHGYFIEISRHQAKNLPKEYYRKQTLVGYERFSNEELSNIEVNIREAETIVNKIEQERFNILCQLVISHSTLIKKLTRTIGELDFFLSLANIAFKREWVRPEWIKEDIIEIIDGRHPVIEHYLSAGEQFTPNDLYLDAKENVIGILTGPNMAGKSTYIRQIALIQLMAQIGSFVPAKKARLGVRDSILTRMGSGDNLTRGESTFFVEMLQVARILNKCTSRSLVVMDEVGRGTSTYDGLAIAWSVIEHLNNPKHARPFTLFATHYHELTELGKNHGILNLTMEVHEVKGKVIFLHRVKPGIADRSYGIHVAHLAGLPQSLIVRANNKLTELEDNVTEDTKMQTVLFKAKQRTNKEEQNSLFQNT